MCRRIFEVLSRLNVKKSITATRRRIQKNQSAEATWSLRTKTGNPSLLAQTHLQIEAS